MLSTIGRVDHLVYTAGESLTTSLLADLDLAAAQEAWRIRYWGALAAVKHARVSTSITLTSGSAGARPGSTWANAAAVCGATEALGRALAVELAPVRVNVVAPGVVRTDLWRDIDAEALFSAVGEELLTGRVGEAAEIGEAYLHLLRSGFTTGTTLRIDGGALLA